MVVLRGETHSLAAALAKVYELVCPASFHAKGAISCLFNQANSMDTVTIKAPNWLHRHLLGHKGVNIKPIHDSHPNVRVNFGENDVIDIEGPTPEAKEVAQKLQKSVTDLVCWLCFETW